MSLTAVLVIDLQNDYFPAGRYPLVGIEAAAANAARVIDDARARGVPVIHVRHEFVGADAPFFAAGSEGAAIHPSVRPREGETVLLKHFPNPFRETGLKARLEAAGIDALVVVGAMSHMCIDATVRAAADFGYPVQVVRDACATRDLEFDGVRVPAAQVQAAMMASLGFAYAQVIDTAAYLSAA